MVFAFMRSMVPRQRRPAEHVAHAAHRVEELGEAGSSSSSLRSQWTWTSTVRDSPRVVVAPDVLEQLVAGEHLARVAEQEREQLERLGLERHGSPSRRTRWPGEVHLDAPEVDERRRLRSAAACSARRKIARIRAVSSRRLNGFVT